ncbi:MAG: glycosyltransferase family 9 protein [Candidatus Omnitrophica bacterium]|jgi:heptosyltransferase-2|nr:glycosyltransferase family 9 protein [Candidatus Omnitrophota bacterium]
MEQIRKKILIMRTDRLGDVILSTPAIANLRKFYPDSYIAFLCRPYTKEVIEGNPHLDEIIIYDKNKEHKSIFASIKFCLALRKKKFDTVFILNPNNRSNIIALFAGIPERIGLNRKMGRLLTHPIEDKKHEGKKHELEYTLDILKEAGVTITEKHTYFPIKKESEERIEDLLVTHGIKNNSFLVIHPSASCPSKRWPQDYFVKLIRLINERTNLRIVLISAENEKKFADSLVKEKNTIDLRGILSISDIGALLKRSKLFISNDSGPVHIAASLNCPVISIFGRNDPGLSPVRWRPLGEKSFYIHKGNSCKNCLAHNCVLGFLCLKSITPEEVFALALKILE